MSTESASQSPATSAPAGRHAVARNAFHLVLGQVVTTALAIVLSAALGRSLGASDFGVYFLALTMSTFAYVVVEWGQQLWVIREVARDTERAGVLLGSALALRVAGAALLVGPVGAVAWLLGYPARTALLAMAVVVATLPTFLSLGYGMVFRASDRMGLDAQVSVLNKAAGLALALAALGMGTGLWGVVAAQGLAGVAALALAARLYRRLGVGPLHATRAVAREVLVGGTPLAAMTVAISVQPYIDILILSRLVPPDAVGWYGAAKNIMGTLVAPSMILAAASYPRLSRAANQPALFRTEIRAALRPLMWMGALGGVGTWLFAGDAVALVYGARGFAPAGEVLQAFGPGLFLLFIDVLLGHVITATGRSAGFAVAKVASVVVSTALDLVLVPYFQRRMGNGGIGVVVAFAVSEFVVFAGSLLLMPRRSLEPAIALDVARAAGAAAATVALFRLLPPTPLFVGIPVCVVAFAIASFILGLARPSDIATLRGALRRSP